MTGRIQQFRARFEATLHRIGQNGREETFELRELSATELSIIDGELPADCNEDGPRVSDRIIEAVDVSGRRASIALRRGFVISWARAEPDSMACVGEFWGEYEGDERSSKTTDVAIEDASRLSEAAAYESDMGDRPAKQPSPPVTVPDVIPTEPVLATEADTPLESLPTASLPRDRSSTLSRGDNDLGVDTARTDSSRTRAVVPPEKRTDGPVAASIVLRWTELSTDLDLHLVGRNSHNDDWHVSFGRPESLERAPFAHFGGRRTSDSREEQIELGREYVGESLVVVHDWTRREAGADGTFDSAGATVELRDANGHVLQRFTPPTTSSGNVWTVFVFDRSTQKQISLTDVRRVDQTRSAAALDLETVKQFAIDHKYPSGRSRPAAARVATLLRVPSDRHRSSGFATNTAQSTDILRPRATPSGDTPVDASLDSKVRKGAAEGPPSFPRKIGDVGWWILVLTMLFFTWLTIASGRPLLGISVAIFGAALMWWRSRHSTSLGTEIAASADRTSAGIDSPSSDFGR